jgi:hypothetical protein
VSPLDEPVFQPTITLSQALVSPSLFGKTFAAPSFWTWKVIAKLIDGQLLTEPREIELFRQCTGRNPTTESARPPTVAPLSFPCGPAWG